MPQFPQSTVPTSQGCPSLTPTHRHPEWVSGEWVALTKVYVPSTALGSGGLRVEGQRSLMPPEALPWGQGHHGLLPCPLWLGGAAGLRHSGPSTASEPEARLSSAGSGPAWGHLGGSGLRALLCGGRVEGDFVSPRNPRDPGLWELWRGCAFPRVPWSRCNRGAAPGAGGP